MEYLGTGEVGPAITLDGKGAKGPGPMAALLFALAGCMALDVQTILEKSRVPLTGLEVDVESERAPTHPRHYTKIRLLVRVEGPGEEDQARMERALALSREKFCSVFHSLRQDIEYEFEIRRA